MALYVGEAVRVRTQAIDPLTNEPFEANGAVIECWAPGRNPVRDLEVRDTPDIEPRDMIWEESKQAYRIFLDTSVDYENPEDATPTPGPWAAGKWTFKVTVSGDAFVNWEYGTFTLKP